MSVYLAPMSVEGTAEQPRRFRRFFIFGFIRLLALVLALASGLGCLLVPDLLSFCLGAFLVFLIIAVIFSMAAGRLATGGGKSILESMRDDPAQRSLTQLLSQIPDDGKVVISPLLRLGQTNHAFDLMVVTGGGVTFINTQQPIPGRSDTTAVRGACQRLSEQYSLPLLNHVTFAQVVTAKPSAESSGDWQMVLSREIGRLFSRGDITTAIPVIASTFRALYNLTLPANLPPVPVQGSLPAKGRLSNQHLSNAIGSRGLIETFGKIVLFTIFACAMCVVGVYLLHEYNYELAERVLVPARSVLRQVLSTGLQQKFSLGKELFVGENHIYAVALATTRISPQIGRIGTGPEIKSGTHMQIIKMDVYLNSDWFLVRATVKNEVFGWVPRNVLKPKHIIRKGTPLYDRADIYATPKDTATSDNPVALIEVWRRPSPQGEVVWSKVSFLDKTIRYIRGDI